MNSGLAKVTCFNLLLSVGVRERSKDGLTFSFIRHYVSAAKKEPLLDLCSLFPCTPYISIMKGMETNSLITV
jgi:hypothetical protein